MIAVAGDDHVSKSSTAAHQSDHIFKACGLPVFFPSNVQDILDMGLHAFAMSRFSGVWSGMKTIQEVVESSASVVVDPDRVKIVLPEDFVMPPGGLHIRWPDPPLEQEARLMDYKWYAALAYVRANRLNHNVVESGHDRLGIIASGKAFNDTRQALADLGLDDDTCRTLGIRLHKVNVVWPLEATITRDFAQGLQEILVVEEKRQVIEYQIKEQLYNWRADVRPNVLGKFDEPEGAAGGEWSMPNPSENWLLRAKADLTPAIVAKAIAKRLAKLGLAPAGSEVAARMAQRIAVIEGRERALAELETDTGERAPWFCSGCPHNTSTRVPEGSRAMAGIGCHYMSVWMDRSTSTFSQMGGEGAAWVGQQPFTTDAHVFANLGDGTYFHSGSLAIRQSIAAGVNITYKVLYNDAVAMTGGQRVGERAEGHTVLKARGEVSRLLVIAPIAAFEAWKDDSRECFEAPPRVVVHDGPGSLIPEHADVVLTNYNRVSADYDRLRDVIAGTDSHVILDEAHRIKRGALGVHGRAVLDLAYVAKRRDVLTGTPAPQGAFDLIALMRFLYPGQDRQILPADAYVEQNGRDPEVLEQTGSAISKYFVRTPKSSLGLPSPVFELVVRPMGRIQSAIYDGLVGRYRGRFALAQESRREFNRLGRVVMYLLEAATNPALLSAGSDSSDEAGFAHPPLEVQADAALADLLAEYSQFETPWKYAYVREAVSNAAAAGEKVLVWTTFVRNIRALERELREFNPAVVHGGVPPEDGAPPGALTRESELDRFRHDPSCSVLLANPAACGEGVSLHHWCHHAIYLDRTFNAGHFLQSQDRIHRLGLSEDVETRFTLLLSGGTIDEVVDARLREKVRALSTLMNDPGLVRVALPESDEVHDERPALKDDAAAVAAHLGSGGS